MFPTAITTSTYQLTTSTLPFVVGLRAAHSRVSSTFTTLTDNMNAHPLPRNAPSEPSIPEPSDLSRRQPHAQKRIAAVVHSARWLDVFHKASVPHRARMLSQAKQGAMFLYGAVPSKNRAVLPISFINAVQMSLRLPLSLLRGITTCKCGAACDEHGDHVLTCPHFMAYRTPWHDLIQAVAARMASRAGYHVSHDSRRPRAVSAGYSPLRCPDFTLLHGHETGSQIIVDVTCPSVVKRTGLAAAAVDDRANALSAEASKQATYGNVQPHVVLPFVVEDAGGMGPAAHSFFHKCCKKVQNQLSFSDEKQANWSCLGFSNFYFQSFAVANARGLGHFYMVAAAILRTHGSAGL